MFVGKVVGTVWSTVKWPGVTGHKLLVVRPYHLADLLVHPGRSWGGSDGDGKDDDAAGATAATQAVPHHVNNEAVVCIDLLDAGVGDDVIVAFGHAARVAADEKSLQQNQFSSKIAALPGPQAATPTTTPIDAAVVAVVDGFHIVRPGT